MHVLVQVASLGHRLHRHSPTLVEGEQSGLLEQFFSLVLQDTPTFANNLPSLATTANIVFYLLPRKSIK